MTQPYNAVVTISPSPSPHLVIRSIHLGPGTFNYTISDGNGGTNSTYVEVEVDF